MYFKQYTAGMQFMAADSIEMLAFRENVLDIIANTDGLSIAGLARRINDRRAKARQAEKVSRTFLSNVLHGHADCTITFASDVAAAVGSPLHRLLEKKSATLLH